MSVVPEPDIPARFYVETLGCPKNAVDSDKVTASLLADGLVPASSADQAELVVVNTCAFVEAARQESIDVTLALAEARKPGAKLVVTGCLAERYGNELAAALPEADAVVGFDGEGDLAEVVLKRKPAGVRDLLELPRPAPEPVEASAESGPRPGDVLRSVELPANRELGPTWRKFLEKLTSGFDVLAAPPVPDAPPAPAPEREPVSPALAPVTRSGRHGGSNGDRHALLDGVRLPPNGELVPQWRKFLDKQSIDEGKIEAVKEYLHREFPLCTVYDFFEFERGAHVFQLQDNQGKVSQLATFFLEFFEALRNAEIRAWLEKHKLAQAMRQAGQAGVRVSARGVEIVKR